MTTVKLAALVFLATIVSSGAGCGGDASDPLTGVPSPEPSIGDFPPGTYVATVATSETSDPTLAGAWRLTVTSGARFTVELDGQIVVRGQVSVTGNRIAFSDSGGTRSCGSGGGTYTWAFDGESLTFGAVADACPGRREVLTAKAWTKE